MARRPTSSRKPAVRRTEAAPVQRADLYQRITNTIVAQLEESRVPWVQPWGDLPGAAGVGMPRNAETDRAYSGINVMLLWASGMAASYPTQRWLTFRQALGLGGCVRRGEKGTPVVYANRFTPEQERARASQAGEEARSIAFLKQYTVFNAAQCDGLPEGLCVPPPPPREDLIEPRFRALMQGTGLTIHLSGQIACYRPADDAIVLPPPQAFHQPVNFHRTAAHEMSHATGHTSRLARDFTGRFGSEGYAHEELRGGDLGGLCLRQPRHRAHRPPRRLHRLLARCAAFRPPRHRAGCGDGQPLRRLAARPPAGRSRLGRRRRAGRGRRGGCCTRSGRGRGAGPPLQAAA